MKILLFEDNLSDVGLIENAFESAGISYDLKHVTRLEEGLAVIDEDFDVILLDLRLPDSQGMETFHSVYAMRPDTPIVVNSGESDLELSRALIHSGASDYLVKGRSEDFEIVRTLFHAIERERQSVSLSEREKPVAPIPEEHPFGGGELNRTMPELMHQLTCDFERAVSLKVSAKVSGINDEVSTALKDIAARLCQAGGLANDVADVIESAMNQPTHRDAAASQAVASRLLAYELMGRLADEYAKRNG